ncbi:hypothetical protein QAD02_003058 [Eretmocerus hayati]|uniref:Uncharacterized protein n=1 Tax=Eretmocerus hayati TaxID=131215 RepID=A0ACC2NKK9_9HYME|nr:hypothetical protein QAD02_003058 [Eretmocerus hayati]
MATRTAWIGYADDLITWDSRYEENARAPVKRKSPGESVSNQPGRSNPRGADEHQAPDRKRIKVLESTGNRVNAESPETTVNKRLDLLLTVRSYSVRKSRETRPIKAQQCSFESSFSLQAWTREENRMDNVAQIQKSPSRPRRWLAGAPGGWWPSDSEDTTSDEDDIGTATIRLPIKKRELRWSSRTSAGASSDFSVGCEPQPCFSRQGDDTPREIWPELPQGPSYPDFNNIENNLDLDRSLGSLSTIALASDGEEREEPSSSSSAYGSGSEEGVPITTAATTVRGPSRTPAMPSQWGEGKAAPAAHRNRRTRKERAARNANWSASVTLHTAPVIIDLISSSDDEAACSKSDLRSNENKVRQSVAEASVSAISVQCANHGDVEHSARDPCVLSEQTMPIDVQVYRALCQTYEETLHPVDGEALIDYVKGFVYLDKEALRLRNYRLRKKLEREQEQRENEGDEEAPVTAERATRPRTTERQSRATSRPRQQAKRTKKARGNGSTPTAGLASAPQPTTSVQQENIASTSNSTTVEEVETGTTVEEVEAVLASSFTTQSLSVTVGPSDRSAPILPMPADIARATTSTPLHPAYGPSDAMLASTTHAVFEYTISSAAIAASPSLNLHFSRFLEDITPLPSPAATFRTQGIEELRNELSPMGLMDLDDVMNSSLQIPPTPATPEHLRRTATTEAPPSTFRAHMMSPVPDEPNPTIRMRIVREHTNAVPTVEQQSTEAVTYMCI